MSQLIESLQQALQSRHASSEWRLSALALAVQADLPTTRNEKWRYTNLRALGSRRFGLAGDTASADAELIAHIPSPRIVFVDGQLNPDLSDLDQLSNWVKLSPLQQATQACIATDDQDTFGQLNRALAESHVQFLIGSEQHVDDPIHWVTIANSANVATHIHAQIRLGKNARAMVCEHHIGAANQNSLSNVVVSVQLESGAQLTHVRANSSGAGEFCFHRLNAELATQAVFSHTSIELGQGTSRREITTLLNDDNALANIDGVMLAQQRAHVDVRLNTRHIGQNSRSRITWRGLADNRGRIAFHGGIHINEGADGSDAALSNKNILLSAEAEIDTQPVLEIYADEVQAAHGATIGAIDEKAMFYMRSRGIDKEDARILLIRAFLISVLQSGSLEHESDYWVSQVDAALQMNPELK